MRRAKKLWSTAQSLAQLDPAKAIAFAIESTVDGDLPLTMIGVSYQPGVARALSIDFIDAVKPVLEDAAADEDRARREGGDAGAGETGRGGAGLPA